MNPNPSSKFQIGLNPWAALVFAAVLSVTACGGQGNGGGDETAAQSGADIVRPAQIEVVRASTQAGLSFSGLIQSARRSELAFKASGRIAELRVNEGDRVTQGQVLAVLDDSEFKLALQAAEAKFDKANADFQRAEKIYSTTQAIARSELDKLQTELNLARNQVERARRDLADTQLKAPFQGIIARRMTSEYSRVQANQAIYTLHDLHELEVAIDVPSSVVLGGSRQNRGWAIIDDLPGVRFPLEVKNFSSEADPTSQTYNVVLGFQDVMGHKIFPGMPVKVLPATETDTGGAPSIAVPLGAIVPSNTGVQNLWIVDGDGKVDLRPVETGTLVGDRVTITAGLALGDRIVTAGLKELRPGMRVRPLEGTGTD